MTMELARLVGPHGHVFALDKSQEQLDVACAAVQGASLHNITFVRHDLAMGPPQGYPPADFAFMRFFLMHLINPKEVLEQIGSLLKSGAMLLMEEPDNTRQRLEPAVEGAEDFVKTIIGLGKSQGLDYAIGPRVGALCAPGYQVIQDIFVDHTCDNKIAATMWEGRLGELRDKM